MSGHETHQEPKGEKVSKTSFRASSWLVVILVGVFVAALNFIQVESKASGEHTEEAKTEAPTSEKSATPVATEVNGPAQTQGQSIDTTVNHTEEKH